MNWYKTIKIAIPLPDAMWENPDVIQYPKGGVKKVNDNMTNEEAAKQTKKHPGLRGLDFGENGVAFTKSDKRGDVVVKYTTDRTELISAQKLLQLQKGKPLPGIVQVFSVEQINPKTFALVLERANRIPRNEVHYARTILQRLLWNESIPRQTLIVDLSQKLQTGMNEPLFLSVFGKVETLIKNVRAIRGSTQELHSMNIGTRNTGEYVLLDVGGLFWN